MSLKSQIRNHATWPKFKPVWLAAVRQSNELGPIRRDAAFAHFLGGCSAELQSNGTISRRKFVQILNNATEFGRNEKIL